MEFVYYTLFFFLGSFLMRSAGCIINDIIDRDIDKKVKRTSSRPLARGDITILQALIILLLLLFISFLLLLQLNNSSIMIGLIAFIGVCLYPITKRFSDFPQVFLACIFNIGSIIAADNICNEISKEIILIYVACIFWTTGYDTVYGFTDIVDDKKIGVKSLAIILEDRGLKIWIGFFYSAFIICLFIPCLSITKSKAIYLFLLIWIFLMYKVFQLDVSLESKCLKHFNNMVIVGLFVCFVIVTSRLISL